MARRELKTHVRELKQGDHVCSVYRNRVEQIAVVIPYVLAGLARGECCICVVDDKRGHQVLKTLTQAGVDIQTQSKRGAMLIANPKENYFPSQEVTPREVVEKLQRTYQEKLNSGFSGLRVTGEMTWALKAEDAGDRLMEHEAMLN